MLNIIWYALIKTASGAAVSEDLDEGYGVEEAIIETNEDDSVHGIMVNPPRFFLFEKYRQGLFSNFWSTAGI